ncbi:MAG: hypothetical protein ABH840_04280 [Nanoarchaeota archaeon]
METVTYPERKITPEINEKFNSLFESDVSSLELVGFADSHLVHPGFPHFTLHQQIWVRDHRLYMSLDNGEQVSFDEAFYDYQKKLSPVHHEFYFMKYIQPAFCDPDKNREYLSWSDEERQWVDFEIDRVREFAGQESQLIRAIYKVSPILARKIMEEGLCPGAI